MKKLPPRYAAIKTLVIVGQIDTLKGIIDYIPRLILVQKLRTNYDRFNVLINNPQEFKLKEIIQIGELFELDEQTMLRLMMNQYERDKAMTNKKG